MRYFFLLFVLVGCREDLKVVDTSTDKIELVGQEDIEPADGLVFSLNVVSFTDADISKGLMYNINAFNEQMEYCFSVSLLDSIYECSDQVIMFDDHNSDWYAGKEIDRSIKSKHLIDGAINVFVFKQSSLLKALAGPSDVQFHLGMTPVLSDLSMSVHWSPDLDVIYLSDEGIQNGLRSLVHELGHFFGQAHPEFLNYEELVKMGIVDLESYSTNEMRSSLCSHGYTEEQISYICYVAQKHRYYLLNK